MWGGVIAAAVDVGLGPIRPAKGWWNHFATRLPNPDLQNFQAFGQLSYTKKALSLLNTLQMQFFEAVAELQETLDLQDARARLARKTRAKDASILAFAKKLREAHHVLDRLVDDYADYRRDPKRPRGAAAADDPEPVSDGDFGASLHSKLDLLKQQLI
ncbi:hypothetical protein OsI_35109 [Oryza sativa Indica Group]|uniref:Uncharacterized protein n=1 Tax=Oryza sativa subsp. indica TaxID=39946 RepID=B8BJ41_ORYSI|nr:hypothetical protein OsI_35109 [Oryza sativa Indica Group]